MIVNLKHNILSQSQTNRLSFHITAVFSMTKFIVIFIFYGTLSVPCWRPCWCVLSETMQFTGQFNTKLDDILL